MYIYMYIHIYIYMYIYIYATIVHCASCHTVNVYKQNYCTLMHACTYRHMCMYTYCTCI